MDSPAIAADLASDQEFAVDGHGPQKSRADQKQQTPRQLIIPPRFRSAITTARFLVKNI